jgi:Predicted membrane protein
MQIYYFILYFFIYGFLGWCTEVAYATVKQKKFVNRGFLNGPICPVYGVGIGMVVMLLEPMSGTIVSLYVVSTALVTTIEGVTGYLMDRLFHHKWWDYSNQPLNIGGYVCLLFSLAWGVACVLIVRVIHPFVYQVVDMIPVTVGIGLAAVLGIALLADLYVTTAEILKLNKKLETMEKISAELRDLSDMIGVNIHESVMETMEFSEETKKQLDSAVSELREKLDSVAQEQKDHLEERIDRVEEKIEAKLYPEEEKALLAELRNKYAELKGKYTELAGRSTLVTRRLIDAFPKMESRLHKEMFNEMRNRIWRR